MKNIKIRASIISQDTKRIDKVIATYDKEKNYIYYVEKGKDKTVTIYNFQTDTLERDNEEIYLSIQFIEKQTTIGIMSIKDLLPIDIELEVYTNKIIKNKKKLQIEYTLNKEKYQYKIEYREEK